MVANMENTIAIVEGNASAIMLTRIQCPTWCTDQVNLSETMTKSSNTNQDIDKKIGKHNWIIVLPLSQIT
jgi:hypothetical protein